MNKESVLEVEGKQLKVSNLDKVLYPKAGFTKADIIDYYIRVSRGILPHLKDRPLTLKRYPEGVDAGHFYEKRCPPYHPKWVKIAHIPKRSNARETIDYCMANNLPTLVWAANLADIEMHTTLAKCQNPERPTMMVFDLDPGPPAHIIHCLPVAFWLREMFDELDLKCFAKTSGSKGLQIYVPLNTPVTFEHTKPFARAVAELLAQRHSKEVVFLMKKSLRPGKVFIDWSQNDFHKTTVCVYSLRAKEKPTVSTPVTWDELEQARKSGRREDLVFRPEEVLKRVEKMGDLFEPVLTLKQKLPRPEAILNEVAAAA